MKHSPLFLCGAMLAGIVTLTPSLTVRAADGTWIDLTAGPNPWSNTAMWNGGIIADGAGFTASFTSNISATTTVTLDSSRNISNLTFSDDGSNGSAWLLNSSGGSILALGDGTAGASTIQTLTPASITAVLAGANSLTKTGAGTLQLGAQNTFSGGTIVNDGVLDLTVGGGTGAIRGTLAVNAGATVRVSAANGLGNTQNQRVTNVTLNGGTLDIQNTGNNSITTATITMTGGTLTGMAGSKFDLRNNGNGSTNVTTLASATTSTISVGTLGMPFSNPTFTVASGTTPTGVDLVISSNMVNNAGSGGSGTGTNSIIKAGAGTMVLSGTNSYTGTTTLNTNGGMLRFATQASLYNNVTTNWTAANLIINSGATLAFNVGGTGEFTTTDVTTLLTNLNGAVNNNGLRSGSFIGFDTSNAAGGSFTINNVIANTTGTGGGTVGLTKLGIGTLQLTGVNTFTGLTTVNAGTLDLAVGGSAGAIRSALTVNSGAAVRVSVANGLGNAQNTRVGSVTLNGGTIDIQNTGSNSLTSVGITMTGGTITGMAGSNLDLRNNGAGNTSITTQASSTTSTISVANLGMPGNNTTITVAAGTTTSGVDLLIGATIVNNAGTGGGGTGTSSIIKAGTGSLRLTGTNTFTGDTNLNAGTLILGSQNAVQSSAVNMNGGTLVFDSSVTGNAFNLGGLKGSGNLVLANNATTPAAVTVTVGAGNSDGIYTGTLSGAGSLIKTGTGALILSGTNTFTGGIRLDAGTVRVSSDAALGANGTFAANGSVSGTTLASADATALTLSRNVSTNSAGGGITFGDATGTGDLTFTGNLTRASGATNREVRVFGTTTVTFNGNLTSPGSNSSTSFTKSGTGTLNILGTGNGSDVGFSNVVIAGGSLGVTRLANLGSASSLGTATNATAGAVSITFDGGSLTYLDGGGAASTTNRQVQVGRTTAGGTGTIRNNATNPIHTITFSNTAPLAYGTTDQTRSLILGGTNTGLNTVAPLIADNGTGVVSLVKEGAGTWQLTAANTYTGSTTVTGGTLALSSTGRTGAGAVALQTGGTIFGTGVVQGSSFTAPSGSTIHAGNGTAQASYGTLHFIPVSGSGSFDFQSGSSTILGINPGGTSDLLNFNGLSNGTLLFNGNLQVTASGYIPVSTETFNLIDWTNISTISFASRYDSASYSGLILGNGDDNQGFDLPDISGTGYGWDISQFMMNGTITVTLVPEPTRQAMLLAGLLALNLRRSRLQRPTFPAGKLLT